jgi:hypothetical protein
VDVYLQRRSDVLNKDIDCEFVNLKLSNNLLTPLQSKDISYLAAGFDFDKLKAASSKHYHNYPDNNNSNQHPASTQLSIAGLLNGETHHSLSVNDVQIFSGYDNANE